MTALERIQLAALRAQLVAWVAQIEAMLNESSENQYGLWTGGSGSCAHPPDKVKTFGSGFGSSATTRICGECNETLS